MIEKLLSLYKHLKPNVIDDEFISWLNFANAGMLNKGNVYCMDYAIRNLPSENPIIEIGSFCGLSTNVILYLTQKYNKKNTVITSDKWIFEGAENGGNVGNSSVKHSDYKDYVKQSFIRNVNFFNPNNLPYAIEVFSDEFFELWNDEKNITDIFERDIKLGGNISFAYIDGNHTYEYSKRDFENVSKNLDKGGFILFDDSSALAKFGCAELMKEVSKNKDYKLIMKNPNHLFQKIK